MKKMIAAVATTVACFAASAQTANFEGFSAALNLNMVGASTKTELDGNSFDGIGKNSTAFGLQAAYGLALSKDFVVNIGGTYELNSPTIMSIDFGDFTATGKAENTLSLYVEPGFLISDKTMFYGKLSYESTKVVQSANGESASKSISGMGYGAGVRTMLNKNTFLQVEVKQINYGAAKFDPTDTVDFKTSATVGTVGIGFKF